MIYDCFPFFNELDLLQIRLEEMAANVDWFVLAEAPLTFQGRHKPLYFQDNRHRFSKFAHKIRHIIVDDMPNDSATTPWVREYYQRNSLKKGLVDAKDNDLVIISDADEILREVAIKEAMSRADFNFFSIDLFYYYLDWRAFEWSWIKSYAAPWSIIRAMPDLTRPRAMEHAYLAEIGRDPDTAIIARAGWHFSWLGGPNKMVEKLESFSHTESEVAVWRDAARLAEEIGRGRFFYTGTPLTPVPVDDSFPTLIRTNQNIYRRKGLLSPSPDREEPH